MGKSALKTKGYFEGKEFKVTHVKITKSILNDDKNKDLDLSTGYLRVDPEGEKECPADTATGYYVKSGGNCIFITYS